MLIHGFAGHVRIAGKVDEYSGPCRSLKEVIAWAATFDDVTNALIWPLFPMPVDQQDACLRLNMSPKHLWESFPAFEWNPEINPENKP